MKDKMALPLLLELSDHVSGVKILSTFLVAVYHLTTKKYVVVVDGVTARLILYGTQSERLYYCQAR